MHDAVHDYLGHLGGCFLFFFDTGSWNQWNRRNLLENLSLTKHLYGINTLLLEQGYGMKGWCETYHLNKDDIEKGENTGYANAL